MNDIKNYGKVFETLVEKTAKYLTNNNIKAMILGISGGIDSTVVAAICHEVSKRTGIPLIGRSLPTEFNKEGETTTADLVGKTFCNDYRVIEMNSIYKRTLFEFTRYEDSLLDLSGNIEYDIQGSFPKQQTPIANGNIQARLRMIYLYNLASIHRGLVMDTDNLTENNLGYFTIHGDVGDFNPIGGLWKTEIFKLAEWLVEYYLKLSAKNDDYDEVVKSITKNSYYHKCQSIKESLRLKPTAGLGITDSDLDEIGAESYDQVDRVLQFFTDETIPVSTVEDIPNEIFDAIIKRYNSSRFKRKQLPIKIERNGLLV